jgi:hypothetical protein
MGDAAKITAHGGKEKETKNAVRFATEWGVIYVPKVQLEKIGNPERVIFTVTAEA